MCGIAGSISRQPMKKQYGNVLKSILHRGPDAQGDYETTLHNRNIWLGHTRLSILDLSSAGAQPMHSRSKRWTIVFNGEIYNHLKLRKGLDCNFQGHSDTESLVEAIDRWGIDSTLPKLNGMYAFAALDHHKKRLYLVRDPYGIKPLYYALRADTFLFGSEMRVLRSLGFPAELDDNALQTFLTLRYTPSPQTLLKGIHRLEPGHMLIVDLESMRQMRKSYSLPQKSRFIGMQSVATRCYQNELQKAVKRQLLSDVPVGILLSGGIDSALIAAMAKELGHPLTGFTVGFGEAHRECEIGDAEHTAKILGIPHRSIIVDPQKLWDSLPQIVSTVEEPLGTTSIMPMWYLVQRAREEVTVVLTGQGSDEPWGGYRRYQQERLRSYMPENVWGSLRHLPKSERLPTFLKRGLKSIPIRNTIIRLLQTYTLFDLEERRMLTGDTGSGEAQERIAYWLAWQSQAGLSITERQLRIDARMNLSDDLLLYGDKISMAFSLEARVPMLDVELMEFVESLPLDYKIRLGKGKIVHKEMAESYLPREIVHRKKKGFQVPFGNWCRGIWKDRVHDILFDPQGIHLQYLERKGIEKIWAEHQRSDRGRSLFSLLMFALWCRQYLSATTSDSLAP